MSDRAYTRVTVPLSVLANAAMTEAVRSAFNITPIQFQAATLAAPEPDEAAGLDCFAVRLVDDRPCLVFEDENCNWGGAAIEEALIAAKVPFLQINDAGDEYGPTSTVFDGEASEAIRLDHHLAPVVGVGLIADRVVVDPGEFADIERYLRLRAAVLRWPA